MIRSTLIFILIASAFINCAEDFNTEKPLIKETTTSYLVAADSVNRIELSTLQNLSNLTGQKSLSALVKHGVETFKITYKTTYNDEPIEASGLLYIPLNMNKPAPLISLQHGTTFRKEDAPSVSEQFTGLEYFAAAGYIAIMPDYIGFGASSDIFHPYYDKKHAASAVIDMIHSVKEFLNEKNILYTDQLFLAGYSEGGYVTLAAAKEIEENPNLGLTITAVAAGAGGYDLLNMLESITSHSYYSYPAYLAYVLMSYNNTYQWNKPMSYFFQDKYASVLTTYMNGQYGGSQINSRLTTQVQSLLNTAFYKGLKSQTEELILKDALLNNSVSGWSTNVPIHLYHGTQDEIIPYQNSELTLKNFKKAGSDHVTLTLIPGGTHGSSFVPMLQNFIPWFETLQK